MIYWEVLLGNEDVCGTLEQLYKEFQGARPLASHLGLSMLTVRKKLKECNIKMLPRGGPHVRVDRDVLPRGWWNMSAEQISRLTGYSVNYCRRLRKEKICQLEQSIKTQGTPVDSSATSEATSPSEESDED